MPSKPLTDTFIRSIRPPSAGRIEIADGRCRGLALRTTANGEKCWSFRYRDQSGRPQRLTLGRYPELSLAEARAQADEARKRVIGGGSPAADRRRRRHEADTLTFDHLARRYLHEHSRRFKRSADADERNLRLHVLPAWRNRSYSDLRRRDAVELLELIYASGKPTLANRVKALISRVFSFAVEKGILESSPVSGLRRIADEKPRERVLTDDEIRLAWAVFAASPVSPKVGFALRLALVLGQRAGEIAGMRTDELSSMEHAGGALWTVPAERTKSRRDHLVPLPPLAVSLIRDAMELSRTRNCPWVFPSPTGHTAISAHALAVGMARIAKRLDQPHPLANAPGSTSWRATPPVPHDLRRTCATRMRSLGVGADDVKRVLNHARTDVLGRHYDKYDGLREKRQALETSACELERIIAGGEAHVVIPLDPRRAEARRR